jgi:hypothetical protein
LQGSLRELHSQLERTPTLNPHARSRLQALLSELHHSLHRGSPVVSTPGEPPTGRLQALAVEFEAEHPLLAGALREFVELCSRAGL